MKQVEVNFLEERFTIFNDFKTYKRKVSPIFSSNLLPININFTEYLETNVSEYKYNLSNVSDKALELATSKLRDKLGDDSEILSKKVLKKSQKGSKIIVEVFVKVKEDITDISEIVETEE